MTDQILSLLVDFSVGTLLRYVALLLACLVAIESATERRFLPIALISQAVDMLPLSVALATGVPLAPAWAFLSSALAVIVQIPLLVAWSGFDTGKAIYVALIALMFGLLFSALAIG